MVRAVTSLHPRAHSFRTHHFVEEGDVHRPSLTATDTSANNYCYCIVHYIQYQDPLRSNLELRHGGKLLVGNWRVTEHPEGPFFCTAPHTFKQNHHVTLHTRALSS